MKLCGLRRLRGMFSLGFYDLAARTLILARDPYGIKPMYYADRGGQIAFASSVKALAQHGNISAQRDAAAEVGFLLYGSVPEPLTYLSAVRALPPGSALIVAAGRSPQLRVVQNLREAFVQPMSEASPEILRSRSQSCSRAGKHCKPHCWTASNSIWKRTCRSARFCLPEWIPVHYWV